MREDASMDRARFILSSMKVIKHRMSGAQLGEEGSGRGADVLELSIPQFHAIMATREAGELTVSELAQSLGVSLPSASTMVDRLVQKEVFIREHSDEDRRKVLIRVAPSAVENIEKMETVILASLVDLLEKIGREAAEQWCNVLEEIVTVITEEKTSP